MSAFVEGQITFYPGLDHTHLRQLADQLAPYIVAGNQTGMSDRDVMLKIESVERSIPGATVVERYARQIVASWPSGKNYEIDRHLADLVAIIGPGHRYTGTLTVTIENCTPTDFEMYRLQVEPQVTTEPRTDDTSPDETPVVHRVDARIVWDADPQPVAATGT